MQQPSGAPQDRDPASAHHDRLLPWIAAERALRTLVLLSVGIALVSHPHANWASDIAHLAQRLGLDPKDNWIQRIMNDVGKLHAHQDLVFGLAAIGYGVLEGQRHMGCSRAGTGGSG
jgi:hypothetical protein